MINNNGTNIGIVIKKGSLFAFFFEKRYHLLLLFKHLSSACPLRFLTILILDFIVYKLKIVYILPIYKKKHTFVRRDFKSKVSVHY